MLEAGDVNSLLKQFEASEEVNKKGKDDIKDVRKSSKTIVKEEPKERISKASKTPRLTHEEIRDSLPKEIIEKIKGITLETL